MGFRKSGCSTGASLAYWLGNPLLNPATLVLIGFVLGWRWVGLRLGAGLVLVFGVASFADWLSKDELSFTKDGLLTPPTWAADSSDENVWLVWLKSLWQLAKGVVPELVLLVFLLGGLRAWFFPTSVPNAENFLWTLGLAIVGTLFVIPTAGEIPIVQMLLALGLGVGPAAALLITLPAVSLPSLVMLSKVFPRRVLMFLSLAVMILGVLSGITAVVLEF